MKRFCFALVACSVLMAAAASAQSIAEVAKKEEARRKAIKTPAKVYTDADLKRNTPATPQSQNAAPAPVPSPTAQAGAADPSVKEGEQKAGAKEQEPEKDEAWWHDRITQARTKLDRAKLQADAMQTRINSLTNDWAARDNPVERQAIAADRARAVTELQRLKDEIEAATKEIADIEEEARVAGVPPGWLR